MNIDILIELHRKLQKFRSNLVFSDETSSEEHYLGLDHGHSWEIAILVQLAFSGSLVYSYQKGSYHWFNRISWKGSFYDVDLASQYTGKSEVRIALPGILHPFTKIHALEDGIDYDVWLRSQDLAENSNLGYLFSKDVNHVVNE